MGFELVQPVIKGIQSKGVIANAKHWVMNNQESDRSGGNEVVDDRTRWEMYYPPFLGAIKAEVGSFMCSCENINVYCAVDAIVLTLVYCFGRQSHQRLLRV